MFYTLINFNFIDYNQPSKQIVSAYYKAVNWYDVVKFIQNAIINQNNSMKNKTSSKINFIQQNKKGKNNFILDHIINELEK